MSSTKPRPHTGDFDEWCDDSRPHALSPKEWAELMQIPDIREMWGIQDDETPADFASMVYAAKFHFVSGSPGYVGDLFVLQGDHLTGDPPLVLYRDKGGKLRFAND